MARIFEKSISVGLRIKNTDFWKIYFGKRWSLSEPGLQIYILFSAKSLFFEELTSFLKRQQPKRPEFLVSVKKCLRKSLSENMYFSLVWYECPHSPLLFENSWKENQRYFIQRYSLSFEYKQIISLYSLKFSVLENRIIEFDETKQVESNEIYFWFSCFDQVVHSISS